jgi:putative FmdB family regulatory protein
LPIYEYQCDDCGASFEAFQKMSDDPLTECEKCGGPLRKVLHPVAIHFKGSGFYTTDYGKGSGRRTGARDAASGDSASGSGESSSGDGSSSDAGSKPAAGEGKAKEKQKAT